MTTTASFTTDAESTTESPPPAPLRFRNWPIVTEPVAAWPILLFALGVSIVAGQIGENLFMFTACFAALLATLWRLWIPVTFDLSPRGVEQTLFGRRRRISWSAIARYVAYPHGVMLLPVDDDAPLVAVSGLFIGYAKHRTAVQENLQYYFRPRRTASG